MSGRGRRGFERKSFGGQGMRYFLGEGRWDRTKPDISGHCRFVGLGRGFGT